MEISKNSASQLAAQGIQAGFQKLAQNTQNINQQNLMPLKALENPALQMSSNSLESNLINNQQLSTQIQSLAKVLKTEDNLIGQLFDDWA